MALQLGGRVEVSKNNVNIAYVDMSEYLIDGESVKYEVNVTPSLSEVDSSALNLLSFNVFEITSDIQLPSKAIVFGGDGQSIAAGKGFSFAFGPDQAGVFTVLAEIKTINGSITQTWNFELVIESID